MDITQEKKDFEGLATGMSPRPQTTLDCKKNLRSKTILRVYKKKANKLQRIKANHTYELMTH